MFYQIVGVAGGSAVGFDGFELVFFGTPKKRRWNHLRIFFWSNFLGKGKKLCNTQEMEKIVLFQGNLFLERISTKENTALLPRWFLSITFL